MALTLMFDQTVIRGDKRPDFARLQKIFAPICHVGSVGPNFSFSSAPPETSPETDTAYMLYGKRHPLGRGFTLFIDPSFALFRIVTPLPTTGHDLEDVFAATELLGLHLDAADFLTDERQSFPLEGISVFCEEMKSDNSLMIKDFADERPGFAVSGVKYPLHMTEAFCGQLAAMDPASAELAFSDCLAKKQQADYYYLNPNYYRNTDTGAPMAIYALSEGVDSIIPKEPFIPYGAGPFGEDTAIENWQIALIQNSTETEVLGTLPYSGFLAALRDGEREEFDDVHYLLHALSLSRLQELSGLSAESL